MLNFQALLWRVNTQQSVALVKFRVDYPERFSLEKRGARSRSSSQVSEFRNKSLNSSPEVGFFPIAAVGRVSQ